MRKVHLLTVLTLSMSLFLAADCFIAAAGPSPVFSTPVTLNLGSIGGFHQIEIGYVSCVAVGSCTAVGSASNTSPSESTPAEVAETNGVWGKAKRVALPAGALSDGQENELTAVQCFAARNCVAIGDYVVTGGTWMPMATSEINGVWQQAVPISLPANATANDTWMGGLSCVSMDACTAIGTYFDATNDAITNAALMVVNESGGTWQTATQLAIATGFNYESATWYISCSSASNCTAAGPLLGTSAYFASAATESDGIWSDASAISTTRQSDIDAISCTTAMACAAVGSEGRGSQQKPVVYYESNGVWGQIIESAPIPHNGADLVSVSCISTGNCSAVGDATSKGRAFAIVESHAKWLEPMVLAVAGTINPNLSGAGSISCVSTISCTILGWRSPPDNGNGVIAWTSNRTASNK